MPWLCMDEMMSSICRVPHSGVNMPFMGGKLLRWPQRCKCVQGAVLFQGRCIGPRGTEGIPHRKLDAAAGLLKLCRLPALALT